jgi:cytochrome c556
MTRLLAGLLLLTALLSGLAAASAQGDREAGIKEIMAKLNKPTGIYYALVRELREEEPSWDEAKAQSKTLARLAAELPRHTPPLGDKASWAKLTRTYADNARAADQAVQKMDKAAAQAALGRMGERACNTCHEAHRKK